MIDDEIRRLLQESHTRVLETLKAKRTVLDALAALLSEREVVDRTALEDILRASPVPVLAAPAKNEGQS
jgi:cell division protease FtsH